MAVTYRVDLGKLGTVTWETEEPGLVNVHRTPGLRAYLQDKVISRFFKVLVGALAHPDTPKALAQLKIMFRAYAAWRIKELRKLHMH